MKILGISLLRLGDVFIHLPALQSLKSQFPSAEIHILLNKQFRTVTPLLKHVDRVHEFDRSGLQQQLTDPRLAITNAFKMVREQVDELNGHDFDLVVNLTHNRLTALLAGKVRARSYEGLIFKKGQFSLCGSKWWRELSHHNRTDSNFPFAQVLDYTAGGSGMAQLEINKESTDELSSLGVADLPSKKKLISIQVQTSDPKKSLDLTKTSQMIERIDNSLEEVRFCLLCAPGEENQLRGLQAELSDRAISIDITPLSLSGALSLIEASDLLITSDTSIKHLARASNTPILEIALGSSAPRESGCLQPGSYIIQSRELCSPCKHSEACFQPRRYCADRIAAAAIAEVGLAMLAGDSASILEVAAKSRRNFRIFGTLAHSAGLHIYELEPGKVSALQRLWDAEIWCALNSNSLLPEEQDNSSSPARQLMEILGIPSKERTNLVRSLLDEACALELETCRSREALLHLGLSLKAAGSGSLVPDELLGLMMPLLRLVDSGNFLKYFRIKLEGFREITPQGISELRGLLDEVRVMCRLRQKQLSGLTREREALRV